MVVLSHMLHCARQMEKVCICGSGSFVNDYESKRASAGDVIIKEVELIFKDGTTGEVFVGHV